VVVFIGWFKDYRSGVKQLERPMLIFIAIESQTPKHNGVGTSIAV
jgi:hypothetical protein